MKWKLSDMPLEYQKQLEEKLEALKKVKDTDQYDEIKKKMDEMNEVAQKIGATMYEQQAQADKKASEAKDGEKKEE